MDQTQQPQLGPFCPWSPPDADNWPECPDRHPKFVSEAYLSNLFLDEDHMPHDLQPGMEKDII